MRTIPVAAAGLAAVLAVTCSDFGAITAPSSGARVPSTDAARVADVAGAAANTLELISERAFDSRASNGSDVTGSEGWSPFEGTFRKTTFDIVDDPTAPQSAPHAARMRYPAGSRSGFTPGDVELQFGTRKYGAVQVSVWFRVDPAFQASREIQMLLLGSTGTLGIAANVVSAGGMPLRPNLTLMGSADSRYRLTPPAAIVTRDGWHRWDLRVIMNSPGHADGEVHWWQDGVKILEYRDLRLSRGASVRTWQYLEWRPEWLGSRLPTEMWIEWDHVRVTGASREAGVAEEEPSVPVASVSVAVNSPTLEVGQSTQATATLKDADGNAITDRAVTWTSSDDAIATVSNAGLVKAVAAGRATIKAASEGKSDSVVVIVSVPSGPPVAPVATVTTTLNASSLRVGETTQAVAALKDADGNVLTDRAVTWSSSNPGVATVEGSGQVTAVAAGSATITATSEGKSGSATLTVTAVPPSPGATADTVFYDGFESGTLSLWQDEGQAARHRILTDASRAGGGSRFLEATYLQGTDGAGWLTRWFMPGYDSLYVRVLVQWPVGWQGWTKLLQVAGSRTDNQWSAFGKAGVCPTGTDFFGAYVVTETNTNPAVLSFNTYHVGMTSPGCYGIEEPGQTTYAGGRVPTQGVWHTVEFWVKLNTPGQANATQYVWLDGVLKGQSSNFSFRSSSILMLNSVTLGFSASGGAPKTEVLYMDEVLVARSRPRSLVLPSEPAPAPAPVSSVSVTLNSATLDAGQSTQATTTLKDAGGNVLTDRAVTWSSSNPGVATVEGSGQVTAVAAGSATITATSEGKSGSATLTVTAVPPSAGALSGLVRTGSGTAVGGGLVVALASDQRTVVGQTSVGSDGRYAFAARPSGASYLRLDPAPRYAVSAGAPDPAPLPSGPSGTVDFTVVGAVFYDDFQGYTSTSDLLARFAQTSTTTSDFDTPGAITLDGAAGPDGRKAMRYTYGARPGQCSNATIDGMVFWTGASAPVGPTFYVRWITRESDGFENGATACGNYSFKFGPRLNGNAGWILESQINGPFTDQYLESASGDLTNYPVGGADRRVKLGTNVQWSGEWHVWVQGVEDLGTGQTRLRLWRDGVLVSSEVGRTSGPATVRFLMLGANINTGPDHAQNRWWREIGLFTARPALTSPLVTTSLP